MTLEQFTRYAKQFARMGSTWHDQFEAIVVGQWEDINPNAARTITEFLDEIADDLDDPEGVGCLAQDIRDSFMTTEEVWK